MKTKRVVVGRMSDLRVLRRCRSLRDAESFIAVLAKTDPKGVERGDYYIDAPDEMVQRKRGGR